MKWDVRKEVLKGVMQMVRDNTYVRGLIDDICVSERDEIRKAFTTDTPADGTSKRFWTCNINHGGTKLTKPCEKIYTDANRIFIHILNSRGLYCGFCGRSEKSSSNIIRHANTCPDAAKVINAAFKNTILPMKRVPK